MFAEILYPECHGYHHFPHSMAIVGVFTMFIHFQTNLEKIHIKRISNWILAHWLLPGRFSVFRTKLHSRDAIGIWLGLGRIIPIPSSDTIWLFNIAMENGPFIDGLSIKNGDFLWLC